MGRLLCYGEASEMGEQLTLDELTQRVSGEELTLKRALELFNIHLRNSKLRDSTQGEYMLDIRQLVEFLEQTRVTNAGDVKLIDLEGFLTRRKKRGIGDAARRRNCSAIKAFFGFLTTNELIPNNPSEKLIPPSRPQVKGHRLTEKQIDALLRASAQSPRDHAIMHVLVQTGVGRSEIVRLTVGNVSLPSGLGPKSKGTILVRRKGKVESLPIDKEGCRALMRWLAVRPETAYQALFLSKLRKPMSERGFLRVVEKYGKIADVPSVSIRTLSRSLKLSNWDSTANVLHAPV